MISPRGQRKTQTPCPGCFLHPSRCLCAEIPALSLQTRVSLVIHAREMKRTTNTGLLALKALRNSSLHVRGEKTADSKALDLSDLLSEEYDSLLFYPAEDAHELTAEFIGQFHKPLQLIVPDGNWRQASKVHSRHRELCHLPRVMIREANKARYHLRAENTGYGMSTLQAIAKALTVIEGQEVGQKLEALYELKLSRTLQGRGIKKARHEAGL